MLSKSGYHVFPCYFACGIARPRNIYYGITRLYTALITEKYLVGLLFPARPRNISYGITDLALALALT